LSDREGSNERDGVDARRDDAMKVTVKLYALLSDYLPAGAVDNQVEIDLADGTTPEDVFARFNLPRQYCSIVLVNGIYVEPSERGSHALSENDTLAIWPPVAGG
jgi:molybdopterin converting factor small subunit